MTDTEGKNNSTPLWKGLIPLFVFSILSSLDTVVDIYGAICKPIALAVVSLIGLSTSDQGITFTVEHLKIPWTRDCAGMNTLLVLLAVFTWMNRNTPQDSKYWLKMLGIIPLAIISNVLRILTLVAYRYIFFPEVESPQMHYFWGLFWLIPFALFAIPKNTDRSRVSLCFELLHISSVIGLLAPLLNLNNHWITAAGSLFLLINSKYREKIDSFHAKALAMWILIALVISWSGLESLWLPWLLTCPMTINFKWLMSPSGLACLACACPLFVLIPYADLIAGMIFIYSFMNWNKEKVVNSDQSNLITKFKFQGVLTSIAAILLFLPFMSSIAFSSNTELLIPPPEIKKRVLQGMGYELRLDEQPRELGLLWYDPQGNNRHHALKVCLQYRGISLEDTQIKSVKTDGKRWFIEFFIVKNKLVDNHNEYLWQTLGFRKSPGVHLILVAESDHFMPSDFAKEAHKTVDQLFKAINS